MPNDNVKAVIEALLFVSETPLTLEQIKNVVGSFETSQIRQMLQDMSVEYEAQNRGVRITEVAGGFRMITPVALSPFLKKLYKAKRMERFSMPALETLAIIAYKQPVTRLEIESIRSVKNVDGMIKNLVEKEFIRVTGEKKAPGRPKVYGTTKQFLEYFGLKSLDELPKMEDFSKLAQEAAHNAAEKPAEASNEPKETTQTN
jgi:segregation and condensation protein B